MISDIYLKNMTERYKNLEVISCCARHIEHAEKKGAEYGLRSCTYEEMLSDPEIEIIVVLTGVPAHYELIRQALHHGKHVFTEKTMTLTPEQAEELSGLAESRGLYLCSAPETFLGAGIQTARKAIDEGMIGEIYSFHISANRDLDCMAAMAGFLRQPGGGICQDYGVYYLTALCSLFGGVEQVSAVSRNNRPVRVNTYPKSPEFGQTYPYANESQIASVIRMRNGMIGTFALHGDSNFVDLADFVIYGTKGVLKLGDANRFGGDITFIPTMYGIEKDKEIYVLPPVSPFTENSRGIGVAEMADAIMKGRRSRLDHRFAYHVFETIDAINRCGEAGGSNQISSPCERPRAFANPEEWEDITGEK
ncbi:MAG TPA: Gfo/Idh/MocA family oxidoreductase [Candidatus Mediterraneibacter norfolkensis]|nr:Gfo/Idh/MocA family oxidoreductase [Candidatus Mediterraneibacter norfolkensis]